MGSSELVKVSLESTDTNRAAQVVNAVANAYLDLLDEDNASNTGKVIETLEKEREARSQEVARLRQDMHDLAKQTGEASVGNNQSVPTSDGLATELHTRLADAELEREVLKTQIAALEEAIASERVDVPEARLDAAVDEQTEVQQFNELLSVKRLNLHEIAAKSAAGEQDPLYQQLSKEVRSDQQTLERIRGEVRTQLEPVIAKDLLNEQKNQLESYRNQLAKQELTVKTLGQRLENRLATAKQLSGKAMQLEYGRAELAQAEESLDKITSRLAELRAERDAPARISLLRSATVPTTPVKPVPFIKIAFASLLGLMAPFGLALLWERALRRVGDAEELEQSCNLSVLAEVPLLPDSVSTAGDSSDKRALRNLAMFAESVDGLRTRLMLPEPLQHVRTLAVTSAVSGEGKTTIAAQLAVSIARATGEDTLLIDGDARTPNVHRLLGLPLEQGLSDVLGGRCTIGDAIKPSRYDGLQVLTAGRLPTNPHGVFRAQAVRSVFDELRTSFCYLVIDTPPVLAASEALALAKTADACVVCARWDVSRTDWVQAACERLLAADASPVGIVLNGVSLRHYAYRYGRYVYQSPASLEQV